MQCSDGKRDYCDDRMTASENESKCSWIFVQK